MENWLLTINMKTYQKISKDGHHTDEQHEAMAVWNERLQELMEKERARSN
jgi:hypothetical protein